MNKEQIYDAEIEPLMAQILEICKRGGIAMLASFSIPTDDAPTLSCTSCIPDGEGNTPKHLDNARRAVMDTPQSFAFTITRANP